MVEDAGGVFAAMGDVVLYPSMPGNVLVTPGIRPYARCQGRGTYGQSKGPQGSHGWDTWVRRAIEAINEERAVGTDVIPLHALLLVVETMPKASRRRAFSASRSSRSCSAHAAASIASSMTSAYSVVISSDGMVAWVATVGISAACCPLCVGLRGRDARAAGSGGRQFHVISIHKTVV
eukprot:COSAG02_NODE_9322_length_2256_cov_1.622624_2_plen_178_part_00